MSKPNDEEKMEPKENDKWMDNNDVDPNRDNVPPQQSRLENLGERAKHFAANKYNLVIALLCVLLFIFFIVVIALAVQLGSYQCPQPNECVTSECLSAASVIAARSDIGIDPCNDFWSYSCRGWLDRNPLPDNRGSFSVRDKLQDNINGRIRHMIDLVPYNADSVSALGKARLFFSTCMDQGEIQYWVHEKLKQAIHELGGWAVVNDPPSNWWKRTDVLKKLHVSYGVPAFFRIIVEADDKTPTRNIIKILPAGLGLPSRKYYSSAQNDPYVRAYKDFIKNIVQELGAKVLDASKFAEDIFHYERRLAEITPDFGELRNTSANYKIMTVDELSRLSTTILWTELLQLYFPGLIEHNTEVAILSENYFSDISRLISSTDNSLLNDYYMWSFVRAYTPHLTYKYTLIANHLKQTFEGVSDLNHPYEEKWEFCAKLTNEHLGHALAYMYVKRYFSKLSYEETVHYVQKIIGALSSEIKDLPWLDDGSSFTAAKEKVETLRPLIGFPPFVKDINAVNEYYKELKVQADYFQNIKDSVFFNHQRQAQMLKNHNVDSYSWTISPLDVVSDYKYAGNHLVVPAGLMDLPLFDFGAPIAMKYGVLAGHMANKLSKIFDDKGINYEQYGILRPWLSNRSSEVFEEKLNCLKHEIANYSVHGVTVDPDNTVASFMTDIGGVKLAFEAYKGATKGNEDMLPGVAINSDQLFFLSYAQSLCEAVRPEKLKANRPARKTLPAEMRVVGTLQQLPEFASAFSCPEGSTMNPYHQCHVW